MKAIEEAIEKLAERVKANAMPLEAMQMAQAAQSLANAKVTLEQKTTKTRGGGA